MNRRFINTRQRQQVARASPPSQIKSYIAKNTETLNLENSIKEIETKMDFLLEKLDTLQYKVLQMEFIGTDIYKHSQQLELLKTKILELSKQNAINNLFKEGKEISILDACLVESQAESQGESQAEYRVKPRVEPSVEPSVEPNILLNLKYKVLKQSSK